MSAGIAYLTKRFPRLSETFILDEILGLQAEGVPLRVFAMADPQEPVIQPDVERVQGPVRYLHGRGGWRDRIRNGARAAIAHGRRFGRTPARYAAVLLRAEAERPGLASIRRFNEAILLADQVEADESTHLHAAFAHGPAEVARLVHRLTGISYSFSAHAKDLYLTRPAALARRVRDAQFVLVCSSAAADHLRQIAAELAGPEHAAKIVLAPHGVDTARFRPLTAGQLPGVSVQPCGTLHVLAVGRLVEKKGYPVLLEALARARSQGHEIDLTVIGGGALLPALRADAERLGVAGAVRFLGPRNQHEVVAAYRGADLFAQASVVLPDGDRDGIPNSVLEAMASGLPVVATEAGGIPEVVAHGECGLLAAPGDALALAAHFTTLARDPQMRHRLGRGARARVVESFDRHSKIRAIAPLFSAASVGRL